MSAAPEPGPETARGHGGKIAIFAAFVVVIVAFFALDGQRYLSLEAVKANRDALLAFAGSALVISFLRPVDYRINCVIRIVIEQLVLGV